MAQKTPKSAGFPGARGELDFKALSLVPLLQMVFSRENPEAYV